MTNCGTKTTEKNGSSCRGCRNDSQGRAGRKADREGRNDQPDQPEDRLERRLAIKEQRRSVVRLLDSLAG